MKKLIALVLAMVMLLALTACDTANKNNNETPDATNGANQEATGLTTLEAGKLIMATNAAFPPYEYIEGNEIVGIDAEIAAAIAEKLGLELEILDVDFDAALLAVQQGKSDIVMAGVTVNDDRKLVMDFTDSYATGQQVVIVLEGSDVTMDNLGEKMIGTQMGTTGYIYASDSIENGGYGEDHVIAYDNGITAIQALINGQIDAVIIDNAPAQAFVEANPGLTLLDGEWALENYAIGFAKGNTELVEAVNEALAALIADGTVDAIVAKYIPAA